MKSLLLLWLAVMAFGQGPARKSVLGTVTGFRAEVTEMVVKPENADPQSIRFGPDTVVQRIAPGQKDLKNAETIAITAVALGDRVLISFAGSEAEARRIVVMPATDIARQNEADKQDWAKRGLAGVVASKRGNEITLRMRGLRGESTSTVSVEDNTTYRRYAPDSVKFADAQPSSFKEINVGDQLRARGEKSTDGTSVKAQEVVFGTFRTWAGTITAVNTEAGEVTAKELGGKKTAVIKVSADSQLKKMPSFPGMGAGGPRMGGGPPDLAQMIERMPAAKLDELKPGETIVVSSTKGASSDQLTAIMLLSNAGMLIQMASAQQQTERPSGMGMGGGLSMGAGGLELPGMVP